jgi:hypothetical protein
MADARLVGALVGAAFFLWTAGLRIVDPSEIGWMMRFDWPIHFFGWHFFRSEPWSWPPGLIERYYFPMGTAIGFTDSIPLVAFLLKPIAGWLPRTFQYLGLWLLVCFALQGFFGAMLMRLWTPRFLSQVAGAAMFVLMPTLLIRVGHPALCAHWLLLWALWIACRPDTRGPRVFEWAALGLLAGLIHPYLAVMTLALLAPAAAGAEAWARRAAAIGSAVTATLLGWWTSGLFSVAGSESLAAEGLGHYSMNLLSPISPTGGWSRLLPDWPRATTGQDFEGFQYLGAGTLLLIVVAVALRIASRDRSPLDRAVGDSGSVMPARLAIGWVGGAALVMAVYALSPRVTLGSAVLVDLTGPFTERLAIFRATGRFFWPLAYGLLIWAASIVVERARPAAAAAVMFAALGLQMVDLQGAHQERRRTSRDPGFHAWAQPMASAAWDAALPHYDHLVLYPPPQCGPSPLAYEPAAYVAGLYRLSINAGGVARPDVAARLAYCHDLGESVKAGRIDDRSLYVMLPSEVSALRAVAVPPVVCGTIDGLSVCVTASSYQRWRDAARLD